MVIDKTTGKGCALSIVSKTIARTLIAEGIAGKAICRKPRIKSKNGYESAGNQLLNINRKDVVL